MTERKSREIHVLLTNGKEIRLARHELQSFLVSSRILTLLGVTLLVLAISNPTLFPTLPTYSSRVFYWGISIVIYIAVMPNWLSVSHAIWQRRSNKPIPQIIATGPLIFALTAFAILLQTQLDSFIPRPGGTVTWVTWVKNLAIAHCIELAGAVWLLPLYRSDQIKQEVMVEEAPIKSTPEFIVFNGRSIPLKSILMVRSAEHHLIVTTNQKTTEFRAKLKDFLGQVCDGSGIQTHRSYWVSSDEALELQGSMVRTKSGENIPVSRGRMDHVRAWFKQQGKPH